MAMKIGKKEIIEKTLELILIKGGSDKLTIREIAKAMGCTHPNIYNYYNSMNDLMWDVLAAILESMVSSVLKGMETCEKTERFNAFMENYIRFCLEKIPWYKVMWFERISGEVPERVKQSIEMPGKKMVEILKEMIPQLNSEERAEEMARIINSYVRGSIGAYVTERRRIETIDLAVSEITRDINKIKDGLIKLN